MAYYLAILPVITDVTSYVDHTVHLTKSSSYVDHTVHLTKSFLQTVLQMLLSQKNYSCTLCVLMFQTVFNNQFMYHFIYLLI